MTNFIGQELLYDFVTEKLDSERVESVREFVKNSREAQSDIQRINNGLQYIEQLANTRVADAVIEEIKAPSSYFQVILRKMRFDEWSPGIKMGLEVLVVALGVISVSLIIPWHKLMEINWNTSKEVVLAEVDKASGEHKDVENAPSSDAMSNAAKDAAPAFTDESLEKSGSKTATTASKAKPTEPVKVAEVPKPAAAPKVEKPTQAADFQVGQAAPTTIEAQPATEAKTEPTPTAKDGAKDAGAAAAVAAKKSDASSEKRQGFLWRGSISVTNVSAVSQKFVDKITELGGRKAGEVELGWQKGNSTYFHMTIPESKYQALLDFAKDYGQLQLTKEKHERVMPEGIIRIIFTINEKSAEKKGQ